MYLMFLRLVSKVQIQSSKIVHVMSLDGLVRGERFDEGSCSF